MLLCVLCLREFSYIHVFVVRLCAFMCLPVCLYEYVFVVCVCVFLCAYVCLPWDVPEWEGRRGASSGTPGGLASLPAGVAAQQGALGSSLGPGA